MEATTLDKKTKRNSMLAYVPVHRRNDNGDTGQQQRSAQQQRYSIDGQGSKRSSFTQNLNGNSNTNGARYSSDFSKGGISSSKSTQRYSQQQGWRKGPAEEDDYLDDNNNFNNHRYSTNSHRTSMSSFDPRMSLLDSLSQDDHRQSSGPEEWDELLRQYDRPDEEAALLARKNKRASRIMDPFNEPPAQVPVVGEPTVILDCRDFPKSFKTHHLQDIFREYENVRGGFRVKWIDDTRALIVFEHPSTAKKAYINNVTNAYAKIRPYEGPTDFLSTLAPQTKRHSSSTYTPKRQSGVIPEPLR